jgi:hypothetical protein
MSATVPTKAAFDELEARVTVLEQHGGNPGPLPPEGNPDAPAPPPQPAMMPGTTGRVLRVGPSPSYPTVTDALAGAQDGDTIQLAPNTPRQSFALSKGVLLDGGGNRWDFSGVPANQLFQSKGGIVVQGNVQAWHIKNFTILGCGAAERTHSLIAGIRCSVASHGVVETCTLSGNQNGFAADHLNWVIELRDVELSNNGIGDGLTHNLYCNSGHTIKLTRVTSINPKGGHAIKSRAWNLIAEGGRFLAIETPLEMPEGGVFQVTDTIVAKAAGGSRRFISYGVENQQRGMFDTNRFDACVFDLPINNPFIHTVGGTMTFSPDCKFTVGQGKILIDGAGKVIGLP